jgi:hypothetical protein
MCTAAQLEDRELIHGHDWAQADGLEPARRGGDIDNIDMNVADSYRWTFIDGIRHRILLLAAITRPFVAYSCQQAGRRRVG